MQNRINTMKNLIMANCTRINELLSDNEKLGMCYGWQNRDVSELINKMHELRRDSKTLEKLMYDNEYQDKIKNKLKGDK